MVRFTRARPRSTLSAWSSCALLGELAHADRLALAGRNPQAHLFLLEIDHVKLKLGSGDLLLFDIDDLADAVGRVDHELIGLELQLACRALLLNHAVS
jgi:hypothetical protein